MAVFGDTASLSFILPEGVTFTSDSGVFLTDASPLGPVPDGLFGKSRNRTISQTNSRAKSQALGDD